jgi:UDP:flavonoid glycosyltransferase YjiC (YdhE family)
MGRDQPDNAARVEARGAGLTLAADASAAEIGSAVARLLEEPSFRAAARRLGEQIAAGRGEVDGTAELASIAG